MNFGEYPTFFDNFYFVRQNNCQFRWDENIENIATYFSLFSVVKSIFVKIQHNSCNEFMSWSPKFPDVSLLDVTWSVSLMHVGKKSTKVLVSQKPQFATDSQIDVKNWEKWWTLMLHENAQFLFQNFQNAWIDSFNWFTF